MGLQSVELLKLEDLPALKKHGLICAMLTACRATSKGVNRMENHDAIAAFFEKTLPWRRRRAART